MLPRVKNEEHVMMSIHTMKATVLVSYSMGFRVTDVMRPQPGWDEFLVRVAASGVNPPDTRICGGRSRACPSRFAHDSGSTGMVSGAPAALPVDR